MVEGKNLDSIYVYTNMGLGDHILCNAIVRIQAEKYKKVYVFVKPNNFKNVSYMYRDLSNVKFIQMMDHEVHFFMNTFTNNNYLVAGITDQYYKNFFTDKIYDSFDHGFYVMAGIPFEERWNKFYFERDLEKEKTAFYDIFKLKDGEEFIIVHDDPKRDRIFNTKYLPKGIKILKPGDFTDVGLFDFIYTIEKAKEVHVMNSSFCCLIDSMQIKSNKLVLHEYVRTDMGDNPNPKLKLKWQIIK